MTKKRKFGYKELLSAAIINPEALSCVVQERGDLFRFKILWINVHMIANPKLIKAIFTQNQENYVRPIWGLRSTRDSVGKFGLVGIIKPEERAMWRKDRDDIVKLFTREKLKEYSSIIVKNVARDIDHWQQNADKGISINADQEFTAIALHNLLNTLFEGVEIDIKSIPRLSKIISYYTSPLNYPYVKLFGLIPMPTISYFKYRKAREEYKKIGETVVKASMNQPASANNLIKHLAKAYNYDTYEQLDSEMKIHLRDEVTNFLFAGHETTAATLMAICMFLSLYPTVNEKVREEVKNVIGTRDPTYDDLENLRYTRAVVQETLRLWPPGTCITRNALKDVTIEGYEIKKGDFIVIPVYATQRMSKYWKNPRAFDPSRFLQPLTDDQKWMYLPFGAGERSCLGGQYATMQAMFVIALISQRYSLELNPYCSLKADPGKINRLNPNVTMRVIKK